MKFIISHDIDHLFLTDHLFNDLYLPKLAVRSTKLFLQGVISANEWHGRLNPVSNYRIHRIPELLEFERKNKISASFFMVMRKGKGVGYSSKDLIPVIELLKENQMEFGVHGMDFQNYDLMLEEKHHFEALTGNSDFGIRMHYLRKEDSTLSKLSKIGYKYDSSSYDLSEFGFSEGILELPIGVMDTYAVKPNHKDLKIAKDYTKRRLDEAIKKKVPFFVINFHDIYFSSAYRIYQEWFIWVIEEIVRGNPISNFSKALDESS